MSCYLLSKKSNFLTKGFIYYSLTGSVNGDSTKSEDEPADVSTIGVGWYELC